LTFGLTNLVQLAIPSTNLRSFLNRLPAKHARLKRSNARRPAVRSGLLWVLGSWLFAAAPILAQSTAPPAPLDAKAPGDPDFKPSTAGPGAAGSNDLQGMPALDMPALNFYRFWVNAEYLAYWVKSAPQPISLVSGDPANPTQELLGSNQNFGMFSGARIGFGVWLDDCNILGLDGNLFALQQRSSSYSASSNAFGSPTLAFPFTNQTPGAVGDTLMPIASPGAFAGTVQVASTLQLWGGEANGVLSLMRAGDFQVVALAGMRYVDLSESLSVGTVSSDILTAPNTTLTQNDLFSTRNQFYGGQIGSRITWQNNRFSVDLTGKLAAGVTHEAVDALGVSTQTGPGGVNGTFPGGFFAQPSNSGHFTGNQFSLIPSAQLKLSVLITSQLRAFIGYDFMYWTNVVRPGNQVDHNINLTQSAVLGAGSLMGPAYPAPLFNRSDFWAQGFNLGLELRF